MDSTQDDEFTPQEDFHDIKSEPPFEQVADSLLAKALKEGCPCIISNHTNDYYNRDYTKVLVPGELLESEGLIVICEKDRDLIKRVTAKGRKVGNNEGFLQYLRNEELNEKMEEERRQQEYLYLKQNIKNGKYIRYAFWITLVNLMIFFWQIFGDSLIGFFKQ